MEDSQKIGVSTVSFTDPSIVRCIVTLSVTLYFLVLGEKHTLFGQRQANLVLIAYASSEGSGEPAHPRSLARTFAACSYKQ